MKPTLTTVPTSLAPMMPSVWMESTALPVTARMDSPVPFVRFKLMSACRLLAKIVAPVRTRSAVTSASVLQGLMEPTARIIRTIASLVLVMTGSVSMMLIRTNADVYAGYSGRLCNVDINECQSYPCANGGTCHDLVGGFYLRLCRWMGPVDQCEINKDDCLGKPCLNAGSCIDGQRSYTCKCQPGFTGHDCEINVNECLSNPCHNQSHCIDGINSFTCICKKGTKGTFCQIDMGFCQPNPCMHGGSCKLDPGMGSFVVAQDGFEGDLCEINVDDCDGHQCQNGASCIDQVLKGS